MPRRIFIDLDPLRESSGFRFLFAGQLVTTVASALTMVAVPYQVYALTHSSLQVGAVSLVQLIPLIAGALAGGAIGDSVDRRRILIVVSLALSLTSAALALNTMSGRPSVGCAGC
jgi:MFS family permease